jgi:hypothetical protein
MKTSPKPPPVATTLPPPTETVIVERTRAVPAGPPLRILCIHGVGHAEADETFEASWRSAVNRGLNRWGGRAFDAQFFAYDQLFDAAGLSASELMSAIFHLTASGIFHGIGDAITGARGLFDIPEALKWTAGMVAQWAAKEKLRAKTREKLLKRIAQVKPDLILAHSLGSLITYDLFACHGKAPFAGRVVVTFGSQIGNPFVRDALGGRIIFIEGSQRWFHLFNVNDRAFAARLRVVNPAFEQVLTPFDLPDLLDHDALSYLRHPNTVNTLWRFASELGMAPATRGLQAPQQVRTLDQLSKETRKIARTAKPREPRALLVGINEYWHPKIPPLEGCVNDVFHISATLQEYGFKAENIRVVLNERATSKAVLERLEWLLDGAEDEQPRILFYSGHGAQIPTYGVGEKVDGMDECMVTYDFDWSREKCLSDDQFYELYSQLPPEARFVTMFDCCHSGGLARDGDMRVRGLTPPDDIRHRALEWNRELHMWQPRKMPNVPDEGRTVAGAEPKLERRRLGRRSQKVIAREGRTRRAPFEPVILEACREGELAYEYRHGVQSYGAFTWCFVDILQRRIEKLQQRKRPQDRRLPSWDELMAEVRERLQQLGYKQHPQPDGDRRRVRQPIDWTVPAAP